MSKKQTTTTTQKPFTGITAERFEGLYPYLKDKMDNMPQYSAPLAAGLNPTQQGAIDKLASFTDNPMLSQYASGQLIDPMNNQYVRGVAQSIKDSASDTWGKYGAQINSLFNKNSFWGGSAHQDALKDAAADINKQTSGALAGLYSDAYNTGVSQMLQAQGAQQSAAEAALQAGNTVYDIEDTDIARRYQEFLRQQGYTQQQIDNMLNYFNTGRNPTTTETASDGGANAGSVAGTIAAALLCFPAGAKIATPNGDIPIEKIGAGHTVYTLDFSNNMVEAVVEKTISGGPKPIIEVVTDGEKLEGTEMQPIILADGSRVALKDLEPGDDLFAQDGYNMVEAVNYTDKKELVYDLKVSGRNVYFVNGFAVEGGF